MLSCVTCAYARRIRAQYVKLTGASLSPAGRAFRINWLLRRSGGAIAFASESTVPVCLCICTPREEDRGGAHHALTIGREPDRVVVATRRTRERSHLRTTTINTTTTCHLHRHATSRRPHSPTSSDIRPTDDHSFFCSLTLCCSEQLLSLRPEPVALAPTPARFNY